MTAGIVITGGSRGIGAAVASEAARRGIPTAILSRSSGDSGHPAGALSIDADVADEESVEKAFSLLDSRQFAVSGLVNCAGFMGPGRKVVDCTFDEWTRVLEVNLTGTFLASRAGVRRMAKSRGGTGGTIVNVSSMAAVLGGAGEYVHYAAAKGAVESFTIGLSREVAAEGIRVNAVRPGIIDTTLHHQGGDLKRAQRLGQTVPVGRAGDPAEVANAILWLLSAEASYITGAILPVSGGR